MLYNAMGPENVIMDSPPILPFKFLQNIIHTMWQTLEYFTNNISWDEHSAELWYFFVMSYNMHVICHYGYLIRHHSSFWQTYLSLICMSEDLNN